MSEVFGHGGSLSSMLHAVDLGATTLNECFEKRDKDVSALW